MRIEHWTRSGVRPQRLAVLVAISEQGWRPDPALMEAVRAMGPTARGVLAVLVAPGPALHEVALLDRLRLMDPKRWGRPEGDVSLMLGSALLRLRAELEKASAPVELFGSTDEGWTVGPRLRSGPVQQGGEAATASEAGQVPPEACSFSGRVLRGGGRARA